MNIFKHDMKVNKEMRNKKNGHPSKILWFTGLSGSGKSTIASHVEYELHKKGIHTYLLDGDNVRLGINNNLGFTELDRRENIRRISEIGKLFVDSGTVVLVSAISPFLDDRKKARGLFEQGDFIEIYVKCSIEECERRDPKGLYEKAKKGIIKEFTGISSPYEEPVSPEITIQSDCTSLQDAVSEIISHLENRGIK